MVLLPQLLVQLCFLLKPSPTRGLPFNILARNALVFLEWACMLLHRSRGPDTSFALSYLSYTPHSGSGTLAGATAKNKPGVPLGTGKRGGR